MFGTQHLTFTKLEFFVILLCCTYLITIVVNMKNPNINNRQSNIGLIVAVSLLPGKDNILDTCCDTFVPKDLTFFFYTINILKAHSLSYNSR